jgi:hypothetical protein
MTLALAFARWGFGMQSLSDAKQPDPDLGPCAYLAKQAIRHC